MLKIRDIFKKVITEHSNNCLWLLNDEHFTFDTYNILQEDVAHDEYIREFARYITNKICKELESFLTEEEKGLLKTKSIRSLDKITTNSFESLYPLFMIDVCSFDSKEDFPNLRIDLRPKNTKYLASMIKDSVFHIDLYIMEDFTKVNMGRLKALIIHKENLDHEIIHFLDSFKTNILKQKLNKEKYDNDSKYYFNFPTEYHAYSQQIISKLYDKYNQFNFKHKDIDKLLSNRNEDNFIDQLSNMIRSKNINNFMKNLNIKNRRNFISRICNYLLEKQFNESALDRNDYETSYIENFDQKTYKKIFDPKDEGLYLRLLYKSLPNKKVYINL